MFELEAGHSIEYISPAVTPAVRRRLVERRGVTSQRDGGTRQSRRDFLHSSTL